jgi:Xaa-Pro aminopeptidase
LELDVLPARLFLKAQELLAEHELVDVAPFVLRERMIKDDFERRQLSAAAGLYEAVHKAILQHLRPGIREVDLAGEIARAVRQAGHEGISFYRRWDAHLQAEGIVASGPNLARISGFAMTVTGVGLSRALPWGASDRVIQARDLVVVDLGLNRAGYHADMSRTYVAGAADDSMHEAFAVVLACQQAAIDFTKPGVVAEQIYKAGVGVVVGSRWEEHLQGYGSEQAHYIGHGVGLDLDEPPVLALGDKTPLEEGMVLTVEPKLIGREFGAIQIEDTVVVTSNGASIMSTVPRELFEVRPS